MIIIPNKWEASRDRYGWTLIQFVLGKDKRGAPKWHSHMTYHATLLQCLSHVCDHEAALGADLREVMELLSILPKEMASYGTVRPG